MQALDSLRSQDGVPLGLMEVVVVVDGADAPLAARLRALRPAFRLVVVERPRGGTAAAYEAGWKLARAGVVLFLAGSVRAGRNLVACHLEAHRQVPGAVVLGSVVPQPGRRSAIDAYEDRMRSKKQRRLATTERPAGIHDARNVSCGRAALERVGGFEVWLPVDADVDLGERLRDAGYPFVFRPDARAADAGGQDPREWAEQYRIRGRLALELHSRRPDHGGAELLVACFHDRNAVNRLAVRLALSGRRRQERMVAALAALGFGSYRIGLRLTSAAAFSVLANVLYWSGVRDGLRGNGEFWRLVRATRGYRARPYELASARG